MLLSFFKEICREPYHQYYDIHVPLGNSKNLSSTSYPHGYPRMNNVFLTCFQIFAAEDTGFFQIQILDSRISPADTIGIGTSSVISFANVVYGLSAANKGTVRTNHPKSIHVPTTSGSKIWIVFAVVDGVVDVLGVPGSNQLVHDAHDLHQFQTLNAGFLIEVALVDELGMY